ncbi:unnamed protein product [Plutella xylostella]|uniref:(diamondback moth) hypothetical protein n=1 Tax=Plutella xylostella TaxID=51655 RepID=A0A8S4E3R3_PLUXY|nr:unnamed protein product [Plutella xylostella]
MNYKKNISDGAAAAAAVWRTRGRSTSQLLCQFTNEVNDHLHNRQHVLAVFIDFSKAFDTLQYNTLYKKLSQNGVQGPLLDWFKDYHKNRKTTVKISDTYSNHILTHQGTAQGSILGPTEYLLYVNDMSNVLEEGSVYQFADDTCLLVSNTCLRKAECALQRSFDQLCRWAHDVGLTINAQKTKAMHIHSAHLRTGSDYEPTITAHLHDCLHSNNNPVCNCPKLEFIFLTNIQKINITVLEHRGAFKGNRTALQSNLTHRWKIDESSNQYKQSLLKSQTRQAGAVMDSERYKFKKGNRANCGAACGAASGAASGERRKQTLDNVRSMPQLAAARNAARLAARVDWRGARRRRAARCASETNLLESIEAATAQSGARGGIKWTD